MCLLLIGEFQSPPGHRGWLPEEPTKWLGRWNFQFHPLASGQGVGGARGQGLIVVPYLTVPLHLLLQPFNLTSPRKTSLQQDSPRLTPARLTFSWSSSLICIPSVLSIQPLGTSSKVDFRPPKDHLQPWCLSHPLAGHTQLSHGRSQQPPASLLILLLTPSLQFLVQMPESPF